MQDLEQTIRERAYHLWLADGARDGNSDAHWLIAQREILAGSLSDIGRVTISGNDSQIASKKAAKKSKVSALPKASAPSKSKRRAA
jgi:hypothetical protein